MRHNVDRACLLSRPVRGVWVETILKLIIVPLLMSRPVRGVWVETSPMQSAQMQPVSRPVRGVWVETREEDYGKNLDKVTPRAGRVG